jgi:hypothetical protein
MGFSSATQICNQIGVLRPGGGAYYRPCPSSRVFARSLGALAIF